MRELMSRAELLCGRAGLPGTLVLTLALGACGSDALHGPPSEPDDPSEEFGDVPLAPRTPATIEDPAGPIDPVDPVDPQLPPAACAGQTPIGNYEARSSLGPANTSQVHWGLTDRIYSYPLPRALSGAYAPGFLQQGDHPQTPTELTLEWAISRCAGDMGYYQTEDAKIVDDDRGGQPQATYPCGGTNGAAGGVVYWSFEGSFYECKITPDDVWYINVRYTDAYPSEQVPVSYFWSVH